MSLAARLLANPHAFGPEVLAAIRESMRETTTQEEHAEVAREELGLVGYSAVAFDTSNYGIYVINGATRYLDRTPCKTPEPEKVNWQQEGF